MSLVRHPRRFAQERAAGNESQPRRWQFGLRTLLFWTVIAAACSVAVPRLYDAIYGGG